jgi:hypothetical protein
MAIDSEEVEAEIEREVLAVHKANYGVGSKATHVHVAGDFVLVAV